MKSILFLGIGILLLIAAGILSFGTVRFLRDAAHADGVVIALNAGGSHPQIRFELPDGRPISYSQGGWIAGYQVGDRVDVRYRASDPVATATIAAIGSVWAWPIALAFLGTVFALAGMLNRTGGN